VLEPDHSALPARATSCGAIAAFLQRGRVEHFPSVTLRAEPRMAVDKPGVAMV
jgi:hypothetical protein